MVRTSEHNAAIGEALKARRVGEQPKRCPACELVKPREEFGRRTNGYSKSYCRSCEAAVSRANSERDRHNPAAIARRSTHARKVALRRYHGLTLEQLAELVEAQGGRCLVCEAEPPEGKRLHIDHDHRTGVIRGLLCNRCNLAVGMLQDDAARARALAAYLERPPTALRSEPGLPSGRARHS